MKVLLMGGTGAMGVPLAEFLSKQKNDVTVTSRSQHDAVGNVKYVQINAKDDLALKKLLSECEYDVIVDFLNYNTAEFGKRIELLLKSTGQYVFLSSCRVFAVTDKAITEKTPRLLDKSKDEKYLSTDDYPLAKARQEDLLKNNKHTNWTIIRPSLTYNSKHLPLGSLEKEQWLYRVLKGRSLVFPEDMKGIKTALASGEDVAKSIASLLGKEDALSEDFNIASEKSITWDDVLDIYIRTLEKNKIRRPKIVYGKDVKLKEGNNSQITYARGVIRHFDCSKLRSIGVYDIQEPQYGLNKALCTFLKSPAFFHIDWKYEAWSDMESHEFPHLSEFNSLKSLLKYSVFRLHLGSIMKFVGKA